MKKPPQHPKQMFENMFLAHSNWVAVYPLTLMARSSDWRSFVCLLNVALASYYSHLFECHKHGMPGNGLSPRVSYLLNRWDVVGVYIFAMHFGIMYLDRYGPTMWPMVGDGAWPLFLSLLIAMVFLRISEYDKYNADRKNTYIVTHTVWHVSIFTLIGLYYSSLF